MKQIIFILGANHSGSTLIGCILGAYHNPLKFFHIGEAYSYFKTGDPDVKKYGEIWTNIDHKVGYENAYKEIFTKSKAKVIIDSSKRNVDILNGLEEYSFHIVISFRPFIKIAKSQMKRDKKNQQIIKNLSIYANIKNLKYPFTIVNVEKLILNPKDITKKLCKEVRIPYFEGKENYWKYPTFHLYGAKMQRHHFRNPNVAEYDVRKVKQICPDFSFLQKNDLIELENFLIENSI
jgi:hypothetical protein